MQEMNDSAEDSSSSNKSIIGANTATAASASSASSASSIQVPEQTAQDQQEQQTADAEDSAPIVLGHLEQDHPAELEAGATGVSQADSSIIDKHQKTSPPSSWAVDRDDGEVSAYSGPLDTREKDDGFGDIHTEATPQSGSPSSRIRMKRRQQNISTSQNPSAAAANSARTNGDPKPSFAPTNKHTAFGQGPHRQPVGNSSSVSDWVTGSLVDLLKLAGHVTLSTTGKLVEPPLHVTQKVLIPAMYTYIQALWYTKASIRLQLWFTIIASSIGHVTSVLSATETGQEFRTQLVQCLATLRSILSSASSRQAIMDGMAGTVKFAEALNTPEMLAFLEQMSVLSCRLVDVAAAGSTKAMFHDMSKLTWTAIQVASDPATTLAFAEVTAYLCHALEQEQLDQVQYRERQKQKQKSGDGAKSRQQKQDEAHKTAQHATYGDHQSTNLDPWAKIEDIIMSSLGEKSAEYNNDTGTVDPTQNGYMSQFPTSQSGASNVREEAEHLVNTMPIASTNIPSSVVWESSDGIATKEHGKKASSSKPDETQSPLLIDINLNQPSLATNQYHQPASVLTAPSVAASMPVDEQIQNDKITENSERVILRENSNVLDWDQDGKRDIDVALLRERIGERASQLQLRHHHQQQQAASAHEGATPIVAKRNTEIKRVTTTSTQLKNRSKTSSATVELEEVLDALPDSIQSPQNDLSTHRANQVDDDFEEKSQQRQQKQLQKDETPVAHFYRVLDEALTRQRTTGMRFRKSSLSPDKAKARDDDDNNSFASAEKRIANTIFPSDVRSRLIQEKLTDRQSTENQLDEITKFAKRHKVKLLVGCCLFLGMILSWIAFGLYGFYAFFLGGRRQSSIASANSFAQQRNLLPVGDSEIVIRIVREIVHVREDGSIIKRSDDTKNRPLSVDRQDEEDDTLSNANIGSSLAECLSQDFA